MSARTIWRQLRAAGATEAGAAGLMGNMEAESVMLSYNLQDTSNASLQMSDAGYTQAVDNGTYDRFTSDQGGYGLCQWTHPERKAQLLAYAQSQGVSIGDEDMQVRFCISEMRRRNPAVWSCLCTTNDIYEAASRVCCEYEQPAVNNIDERYRKGLEYYNQLSGSELMALPDESEETNFVTSPICPEPLSFVAKWTADMSTLCIGFSGAQVWFLQHRLNELGYTVEESGDFDADTDVVVRQYQSNNGLVPDGIVGKQTWTALLSAGK